MTSHNSSQTKQDQNNGRAWVPAVRRGVALPRWVRNKQLLGRTLAGVPWLTYLLFFMALLVSGLVLYKVQGVSANAHAFATSSTREYVVKKNPLTADAYVQLQAGVQRLHPDVRVVANPSGLAVSIDSIDKHAEWLFALAAVQSRGEDVIWDVDSLCVGRCTGGIAVATVKGYRQQLDINARD